jgi:hypothetical protein
VDRNCKGQSGRGLPALQDAPRARNGCVILVYHASILMAIPPIYKCKDIYVDEPFGHQLNCIMNVSFGRLLRFDSTTCCPKCGESERRQALPIQSRPNYLLIVFGGVLLGVLWLMSQDKKFQCGACEFTFFSPTPVSRLCSFLCYVIYFIATVGVIYGLWSAFFQ